MAGWRHELHSHPETAFAENRTAELAARLLESFGVAVDSRGGSHRGDRHAGRIKAGGTGNRAARRYRTRRRHRGEPGWRRQHPPRPAAEHGRRGFRLVSREAAGRLYLDRQRRRRRPGDAAQPHYDFNDEVLALGASYGARLAETVLEKG